jgi:hypothetical protein
MKRVKEERDKERQREAEREMYLAEWGACLLIRNDVSHAIPYVKKMLTWDISSNSHDTESCIEGNNIVGKQAANVFQYGDLEHLGCPQDHLSIEGLSRRKSLENGQDNEKGEGKRGEVKRMVLL